jgi:LacI family transcriptional regulator
VSSQADAPPPSAAGEKKRLPRVALLIETSNAYARGLLRGIEAYVREHRAWSIYLVEHGRGDAPPRWLHGWDGNGIIARIENKTIARGLEPLKVPVVDVSAACLIPSVPYVETDDAAIAELAATHFMERGFKSFAFCGDPRFEWANQREMHFARIIRDRRRACFIHRPAIGTPPEEDAFIDELGTLVAKLPKPLAVFACYDFRGRQVLEACRRRGLAVPEEVAVLGVDDDDVLCNLAPVPMSSIKPNTLRTGYEAAALLERMMSGERVAGTAHLIPPIGVVTRQSTDVTAADDVHVAQAARFIRENACSGIGVGAVVAAVPMARRVLERRFRAMLGRTLREEISRVQMQRVKELLVGTALPLAEIASRVGYKHVEYLTFAFKRECGVPPSAYRQQRGSSHG